MMARHHLKSKLADTHQSFAQAWLWYEFQRGLLGDESSSVLEAISAGETPAASRYFGQTPDEMRDMLDRQLAELGKAAMLVLLSATEAALRVDFIDRVAAKGKDGLSKRFAELDKQSKIRPRLSEDVLEAWLQHLGNRKASRAINDFRGAIGLRDWLAHGRYWRRPGLEYDLVDVFDTCDALLVQTSLRWAALLLAPPARGSLAPCRAGRRSPLRPGHPRRIQKIHPPPQMRDHDRPAHDQRHIKDLEQLLIAHADLQALIDVVRNTIIATQHHRRDQPHQLLGLPRQRAVLIRLPIQRKEPLGHQRRPDIGLAVNAVPARLIRPQNAAVQPRPELMELLIP